jgi:hypothetical protein
MGCNLGWRAGSSRQVADSPDLLAAASRANPGLLDGLRRLIGGREPFSGVKQAVGTLAPLANHVRCCR